jgi:hypothetical protein
LSEVNNRPRGENSPNLVTLLASTLLIEISLLCRCVFSFSKMFLKRGLFNRNILLMAIEMATKSNYCWWFVRLSTQGVLYRGRCYIKQANTHISLHKKYSRGIRFLFGILNFIVFGWLFIFSKTINLKPIQF